MDESSGAVIVVVMVAVLLGLGLYVFSSIALGKVFVKLGEQAWKAWVPIVNTITLFELGRYSALWVVGLFIPVVDIGAFIVFILAVNNVNRRLGRGGGFTLLYLVAFPIWAGVLGFGKSVNTGWLPVPAVTGYVPFTPVPPLTAPAAPNASPVPAAPVPAASPVPAVPALPTVPSVPSVPTVTAAPPRVSEPVRQSAAPSSPVATGFPVPVPALLLAAPPLPPAPAVPAAPTASDLPSVLSTSSATPTPPVVRGLPTGPPPFYVRSPPTSPVEPPIVPAPLAPPAPFVAPAPLAAPPAPAAPRAAQPVAPTVPAQQAETDTSSLAPSPLAAPPAPVAAATNAWARPAPVVPAAPPAPIAPALVAPPAPIPVVSAADLAETRTETEDDDLDETMIVVRRMKPWTLETEHGLKVSLTKQVVLLGRNPARGSAHPDAQLVLLQDPGKTVSKTHARLDFVDGAWGIRDLPSTNGIVLIDRAGDESELDAGASASLTERFLLGELAARIYLEA